MEALLSSPRALFSVTPTACWPASARRRRRVASPVKAAGDGQAAAPAPKKILKKKPVYSMKKGQIVRVDKEKYLNSINYLSVGHPPFFKGLDYIYEDRGEVLDIRIFETGEYALIAWVGIPTPPAWLPTYMLIKSDKLDYERI
ncbi:NAD(P)H-quinone oxidoreductase subunit O, chloroplastic isoform X1 [Oryza sativa Japonica Group]|uniref:NAD(P)H-quinone oxidoreductase subunit O, chloroplastic isoform X1 n=1 Tax=Oryza sativa subsp. japonica TaxID=39947 RepID=UPI0007755610|nr:NAD(P)H-quinone oxidoreductase subunit O, chloroplastic isoform X2 [Oryza sativa Japonica Group]